MRAAISEKKFAHALVVGGGFAGQAVAKLLSGHFQHVTLIERFADFIEVSTPAVPLPLRRGIPQGHHLHVLLARGQLLLEHFFPGMTDKISEAGCRRVDWALETEWTGPFGRLPVQASGISTLVFSRHLLDTLLRKELLALPNLLIKTGTVKNFHWSADKRGVAGVTVACGRLPAETLVADLVIDARGRGANLSQLLVAAGFAELPFERVPANMGYASQFYQLSAADHASFCQFYRQVRHHSAVLQGMVISPVENHQVVVTLTGIGQYRPARDAEAFAAHLAAVAPPRVLACLARAQPLSPVVLFRDLDSVHQHAGKLRRWPSGLLALGDAVCRFNPVYGQGMTVVLQEVRLLEKMLLRNWRVGNQKKSAPVFSSHFTRQYQKKVDRLLFFPWLLASAGDAGAAGKSPRSARLLQRYLDFILQRATTNKTVHRRFLAVLHMLKTPLSLFFPWIPERE